MEHLSPIHDHTPGMTRRKFLGTLTGALAAGITVQILGCTTDADFGPSPAAGGPEDSGCPHPAGLGKSAATAERTGSISANHGHTAIATAAAQDAGSAYVLNIQGSSDHNHTVSLTANDVYNLRTGAQLVKTSSNNVGHTHTVTFAALSSSTPNRIGDIGDNHGHDAVVTGVLQDSGAAIALQIQGSSDHNHLVQLTAADLSNLKAGLQVDKVTSPDATGHAHTVTFSVVTSIWRPC